MLTKTAPGFFLALVLGVAFCLHGELWKREAEEVPDEFSGRQAVEYWETSQTRTAAKSAGTAHPVSVPELLRETVPLVAAVAREETWKETAELEAAAEALPDQYSEVASATAHREPVVGALRGLSSPSAFASMNAFCESETSAWIPTAEYPDQPVRGLEVWSSVEKYTSKQDWRQAHNYGTNIYSHDGHVYSLGLRQDWSIDSVVGASIDILDAEVRGRYDNDMRKNDVTGYFANAHYLGLLSGKYPLELKGTYGRLYHEGKGEFQNEGGGMGGHWREKRHRSHYYGFEGKLGVPMIFDSKWKLLPEMGFVYRKIRTNEYEVTVLENETEPVTMGLLKSRSVTLPVSATLKRDYKQCWGLVTPRLKFGYARELDDTAAGVRALNSSSASAPYMWDDAAGNTQVKQASFDPAQKDVWEFEAGLDVRTVSGWNVSGNYRREWSTKYTKNQFSLELGRCF